MTNIQILNPFVYWAQNENNVYLKVDLMDVQDPFVEIEPKSLKFSCQAVGAQGKNKYHFHLDFYEELKTNDSNYKIMDKYVTFIIVKKNREWWPRLISQSNKPHWLKIDFDRWQSPDDMTDNEQVGDVLKDHEDIFGRLQKEEIGYRKEDSTKVYLTCYNFVMYLGFLYICIVLLMKWLKEGKDFFPKAYETVATPMLILQTSQALEVIHPLLGIIKGGALMPFLQIFGRIVVLFFMIREEPRIQTRPVVFFLFLVWSSVEIIRYPYYISQIYERNNKILTWLRYNAWIILYPLGFACEMIILYKSLTFLDESHKWSILMPNSLNFIFNSAFMLRIYILFITTPGILTLMAHMYRVRRQKLGIGKLKRK